MAQADLQRWGQALGRILTHPGFLDATEEARAAELRGEIDGVLDGDAPQWTPWVAAHCLEVGQLAEASLSRAIDIGNDPASRSDRYDDLAMRDVVLYVACWLAVGVGLFAWVRRRAVIPARRLAAVVGRVAEGDAGASIPEVEAGEMGELARAIGMAIHRFEREETLRRGHLGEMRNLVRQLVELVPKPVLVIRVDGRLDYANAPAGEAFGEVCRRLEGCDLGELAGGDEVRRLVDEVLGSAESLAVPTSAASTSTARSDLARAARLQGSAIVRDVQGEATRVVLVFRSGTIWERLLRNTSDALG
jgi:methyl-accepting chemotaxis protein